MSIERRLQKLLAMSNERKDFINKLKSLKNPILQHLAKIVKDGKDGINLNHHLKEVYNWLFDIVSVRDKLWDSMNGNYFFEKYFFDQSEFLDAVNELGGIYDTLDMEYALRHIISDLYKDYLEKRKVPDNDWWKKKFTPAWDFVERSAKWY